MRGAMSKVPGFRSCQELTESPKKHENFPTTFLYGITTVQGPKTKMYLVVVLTTSRKHIILYSGLVKAGQAELAALDPSPGRHPPY